MVLVLRRTTKQCSARDRESSDVKQSTTSLLTYEFRVRSILQWGLSTCCCAVQVCKCIGKVTWQVGTSRKCHPGTENMALTSRWDIHAEDSKCVDVLRKYHPPHTMHVWLSDSRRQRGSLSGPKTWRRMHMTVLICPDAWFQNSKKARGRWNDFCD